MKKFLLILLLPLLAYTQEFVGPGECGLSGYFEQCEMEYEGCSDLCAEDPNCMSFMIDINSGGGCCVEGSQVLMHDSTYKNGRPYTSTDTTLDASLQYFDTLTNANYAGHKEEVGQFISR